MRLPVVTILSAAAAMGVVACQPMQIGLTVDRIAYVNDDGALTITGEVTCSNPEPLDIFVIVTQGTHRFTDDTSTPCDGEDRFALTFNNPSELTAGEAFARVRAATNNGMGPEREDSVHVERVLDVRSK